MPATEDYFVAIGTPAPTQATDLWDGIG
jgi:hypothetical protein